MLQSILQDTFASYRDFALATRMGGIGPLSSRQQDQKQQQVEGGALLQVQAQQLDDGDDNIQPNFRAIKRLNKISKSCLEDASTYSVGAGYKDAQDVVTTYGELLPESVSKMLQLAQIGKSDVFFDLGSGSGRVPLQVFLEKKIPTVGVEFVKHRHAMAVQNKKNLEALYPALKEASKEKLKFKNDDFLKTNLRKATVVYMANTCFSPDLHDKLIQRLSEVPRLRYVISLAQIPQDVLGQGWMLEKVKNAPTSWSSNTQMYFYKRVGKDQAKRVGKDQKDQAKRSKKNK